LMGSIGCSAVLVAFLTFILFNTPTILQGNLQDIANSIKGALILAVIVSAMIYLLRQFVKMTISSYHLSRDAKERYQLTYVYLALIKEGAVTDNERFIILQSLFSRADTGLLKGDATPSTPDSGLVQAILKSLSK
jgi:hypothetical protein